MSLTDEESAGACRQIAIAMGRPSGEIGSCRVWDRVLLFEPRSQGEVLGAFFVREPR